MTSIFENSKFFADLSGTQEGGALSLEPQILILLGQQGSCSWDPGILLTQTSPVKGSRWW